MKMYASYGEKSGNETDVFRPSLVSGLIPDIISFSKMSNSTFVICYHMNSLEIYTILVS